MNRLAAYAVLALLGVTAYVDHRFLAGHKLLMLVFALIAWAFLDEITRPLFGRNADITDWIYDVLDLACGCVFGWLCLWICSSRSSESR